MVEHLTVAQGAGGSIPLTHPIQKANNFNRLDLIIGFLFLQSVFYHVRICVRKTFQNLQKYNKVRKCMEFEILCFKGFANI